MFVNKLVGVPIYLMVPLIFLSFVVMHPYIKCLRPKSAYISLVQRELRELGWNRRQRTSSTLRGSV